MRSSAPSHLCRETPEAEAQAQVGEKGSGLGDLLVRIGDVTLQLGGSLCGCGPLGVRGRGRIRAFERLHGRSRARREVTWQRLPGAYVAVGDVRPVGELGGGARRAVDDDRRLVDTVRVAA